MGLTLAVLNGAIANVALPAIARDLHTDPATSIWVVNAFQLAVTMSLLPLASLGEIHGYRKVYRWGLVVFTIASVLCALSSTLPVLILARVAQGIGAAGIMSVNGALIRFIYPRRSLGRGVGLNATIGSIASAVGPSVASAVLAVGPWPWLFAVNVPLGLVAAVIAWRALPDTPHSGAQFDIGGALLQAVSFGTLLIGISEIGHGNSTFHVVLDLVVGVITGGVLVVRMMTQRAPLLPVDLMRIPLFALSVASSVCSFIAQMMAQVSMPFLFHDMGKNQVMTGPADDTLAADRRGDRAIVGAAGGSLPRRPARRLRHGRHGTGPRRDGDAARARDVAGHHLADDVVRGGIRVLQHAKQPGDHHVGSGLPQRRCQRHAGDGETVRTDDGRRSGGAGVRGDPDGRHDLDTDPVHRGGGDRGGGQFQPARRAVAITAFRGNP